MLKQLATPLATTILVFLLLFLYGKFSSGIPVNMVSTQKTDLFSVSGNSKVTAIPDTARVSLGVTIDRTNVKEATEEANQKINALTDALVKLGVKKDNIKTTNYSIYPQYDYSTSPARARGFTISISMEAYVDKLEIVNDVLDTAVSQGANVVERLQFSVNDQKLKELEAQAREQAIKNAKEKASQIAQSAGITLGKVIGITESTNPIPPYFAYKALSETGAGGGGADVQPGTSEITSSITLTFETR